MLLHSFCTGRIYDIELFLDDYQKGIQQLRGGKLKKWIYKTTRFRGLSKKEEGKETISLPEGGDPDDDEDDSEGLEKQSVTCEELRFSIVTNDNALVFNQMELHEGIDEIFKFGEKEGDMESESDDQLETN
jgi:hypothetical protein